MPRKAKYNLIQKLMFREMYGVPRLCCSQPKLSLFKQLPHRLAFPLSLIAPASALLGGHIFLGFTKCGQFLLSYTYSCDTDDHTLQMVYKYKLHWWLFIPYARLRKIAEVMLFGDQGLQESICENVYIYLCQWPKDLSKILVYGCSVDDEGGTGTQTKRVYLTITAVPSLNNCSACYQVATSYEDDDLAERWNSCVRFSCLQHGITVHTCFEMVPPFPQFLPTVQLKCDGHVVLNAGNFIHVLHVNLENVTKKSKETELEFFNVTVPHKKLSHNSSDIDNDVEETALAESSKTSENDSSPMKASYSDLIDLKINNDSCEDENGSNSDSTLDDLDQDTPRLNVETAISANINKDKEWDKLVAGVLKPNSCECRKQTKTYRDQSRRPPSERRQDPSRKVVINDCDISSISSDCSNLSNDVARNFSLAEVPNCYAQIEIGDSYSEGSSYVCEDPHLLVTGGAAPLSSRSEARLLGSSEMSPFSSRLLPSYSRREELKASSSSKQADEEYEFIDEINESRREKLSVFRLRRLAEKKYEFSDENSENVPQNFRSFCNRPHLSSNTSRISHFPISIHDAPFEFGEPSGLFRSVYEKLLSPSRSLSPTDVLRPIDQNIASPVLSPADDKWRDEVEKLELVEMQRWSSRESLVLHSPIQKSDQNSIAVHNVGHPQNLECVVDIKRRFIEVDDELVSVITDIEDDELSSSTGYHNALPMEVHGSGYTQMHMVSNAKAEKLMVPGVLIRQVSLDVEQFCHETAQRLCVEAGKKYYFCNDYNVEIIDVCPTSGDVIAFASVLMQAGNSLLKPVKKAGLRNSIGSRKLYKATTTFVFNIDSKKYYLLDKEPIIQEDPYGNNFHNEQSSHWWLSARVSAQKLRHQWNIPSDYFSSIKVMTNEPLLQGKSLSHILEGHHLVAIVL